MMANSVINILMINQTIQNLLIQRLRQSKFYVLALAHQG